MKSEHKRYFTLAVVVVIIVLAIYWLNSQKAGPADVEETGSDNIGSDSPKSPQSGTQEESEPELKDGKYEKAPELIGLVGYINTDESISIAGFKGKVVLIDFWTYSCINCIRTLPHIIEWHSKYADKGLIIIGVHTPEFKFEEDIENVQSAVDRHNIEYPVVLDNNYATWSNYKNRFWPRKYLIDKDGFIRYDHIGEGKYDETEEQIQLLLAETGQDIGDIELSDIEDKTPRGKRTPELYAGYNEAIPRDQNIGNDRGLVKGEQIDYTLPENPDNDIIYLEGLWLSNEDNLEAKEPDASIYLHFRGSSVNIVADAPEPTRLYVYIDGAPMTEERAGDDVIVEDDQSYIIVDEPKLYNVYRGTYGTHELTLTAEKASFSFNAFTFG